MPLEQQLRTRIRNALQGLSVTGLNQKVADDLYELFVLAIIIEAAKAEAPVTVNHYDSAGNTTTKLRFPTSPVAIGRGDYTHVRIAYPGKKTLEAHLGVYVLGKSSVEHECDVVVLRHEEAENCRRRTQPAPGPVFYPRASAVLCFTECKCYERTSLTIGHGRAFLGLSQDIRSKAVCAVFVSTKTHDNISTLLFAHGKFFADGLRPGNTLEIQRLQVEYANRFRSFKLTP